jgi:hypothetical protein
MTGFQFAETMSGTFAWKNKPDDQRRLSFSVRAHAGSLWRHLRDGKADLTGTIDADGLADGAPVEGPITIRLVGEKIIRYELHFVGNDGKRYKFAGQKDVEYLRLRESMTTLPAAIYDEAGAEVATSLTRFDLSADWLQFLASFRPA